FSAAALAALPRWRVVTLAVAFVLALGVAEGKLLWYSFHYKDVRLSRQALILEERARLRGHRLYLAPHTRAAHFVAEAVTGAHPTRTPDVATFIQESAPGDFLLTVAGCHAPQLELVRTNGRQFLCERRR